MKLLLAFALCAGLQAQTGFGINGHVYETGAANLTSEATGTLHWVDLLAEKPSWSIKVSVLYRDSQACQNIIALGISPFCSQEIMVLPQSTDMTVKTFTVVIVYTDSFGHRQMQSQEVVSQPQANPELQIVTSAASFVNGIDNVTQLSATVVADDGESVTVRR